MWYYLPKNLSQARRSKLIGLPPSHRLWRQRRFTLSECWKIAYTMWFFIFLIFSIRIGQIGLFLLPPAIRSDVLKLSYPPSYLANRIPDKRHHVNIWIDNEGRMVVDRAIVLNTTRGDIALYKHLLQKQISKKGKDFVVLNVDESASMENVLKMVTLLQTLGVKKIYFRTSTE